MVCKGDALAGQPDLGEEPVRPVKPKPVDAPQRRSLRELLDDGHGTARPTTVVKAGADKF